MLAPDQIRTQSMECVKDADVLRITYDQVRQLYFQNPKFGFYFLQLTSRRLFENVERLEKRLADKSRLERGTVACIGTCLCSDISLMFPADVTAPVIEDFVGSRPAVMLRILPPLRSG